MGNWAGEKTGKSDVEEQERNNGNWWGGTFLGYSRELGCGEVAPENL